MFVDVDLSPLAPYMQKVLSVIADGRTGPTRIDRGLYQVGHWNFEYYIGGPRKWDSWFDLQVIAGRRLAVA